MINSDREEQDDDLQGLKLTTPDKHCLRSKIKLSKSQRSDDSNRDTNRPSGAQTHLNSPELR